MDAPSHAVKKQKATPPSPPKGQLGPAPSAATASHPPAPAPELAKYVAAPPTTATPPQPPAPAINSTADAPTTPPQAENDRDDDGLRSPGAHETSPVPSPELRGLYFAGRAEEAFTIADLNISNQRALLTVGADTEHRYLVTCSQMFGAGKSQMGVRAIARAKMPDVVARLEKIHSDPKGKEVLREYLDAITITVDLQSTTAIPTREPDLEAFLAVALRSAIEIQIPSLASFDWSSVPNKCTAILAVVHQQTNRATFVHWDEVRISAQSQQCQLTLACQVGAIEGLGSCPLLFPELGRSGDNDLQATLRRFYCPFWCRMLPLLRQRHVFVFLTGKSLAFGLLGLGLIGNVSPSKHAQVTLQALSRSDLEVAVTRSETVSGTYLTHWLDFETPDLKDHFYNRLDDETAGQPRLVFSYLRGMCKELNNEPLNPKIDSKKRIEELMVIGDLSADKELNLLTHGPRGPEPYLSMLVMASILKITLPITPNATIWYEANQLPLYQVIEQFNLYAFKVGSDERTGVSNVRIRIADCLKRRIPASKLCPELSLSNMPLSLLSKGDPLELLLRLRLVRALASTCKPTATTWGTVIPALQATLVGKEPVVSAPSARCVYCVPQIINDDRKRNCGLPESNPWASPMHVSHLPAFLASPEWLPENSVGYPAPESSSPDVLLRLKNVLVCFACKLGKKATTWQVLDDEVKKAAPFIAAAKTPVCLVIVALTLGEEIIHKLGTQLSWVVTGREVEVPEGMQVVVLSRAGLDSMLGKVSVMTMETIVEKRRDPEAVCAELAQVFKALQSTDMPAPARPRSVRFELESFLRDEAEIDADAVAEYMPRLLKKNETVLRALATEPKRDIEARLEKWGVSDDDDRLKLATAILRRFG